MAYTSIYVETDETNLDEDFSNALTSVSLSTLNDVNIVELSPQMAVTGKTEKRYAIVITKNP